VSPELLELDAAFLDQAARKTQLSSKAFSDLG
jgi:hypothetical protein